MIERPHPKRLFKLIKSHQATVYFRPQVERTVSKQIVKAGHQQCASFIFAAVKVSTFKTKSQMLPTAEVQTKPEFDRVLPEQGIGKAHAAGIDIDKIIGSPNATIQIDTVGHRIYDAAKKFVAANLNLRVNAVKRIADPAQ